MDSSSQIPSSGLKKRLYFPPELYNRIAIYLGIRENIILRCLCKASRKAINKIPELSLFHFKEAYDSIFMNRGPPKEIFLRDSPFTLLPNETVCHSLGILKIVSNYLKIKKKRHLEDYLYPLCKVLGDLKFSQVVTRIYIKRLEGRELINIKVSSFFGLKEAFRENLHSSTPPNSMELLTSIKFALFNQSLPIINLLLEDITLPNHQNTIYSMHDKRSLSKIAQFSSVPFLRSLLKDLRFMPECWDSHLLIMTASYGNTECLRLLLRDERIDPSSQYNKAIKEAARRGKVECVALLLADARVNAGYNNVALMETIRSGHLFSDSFETVVKLFIENRKVYPSMNHNEAYYEAIRSGKQVIADILLTDQRVQAMLKNST